VFAPSTAFDCTHENVHLEVKWASSGPRKWGTRWEDWPLTVGIKAWWWNGDKGEILLSLFYGSKTLEIAKGKTAIEVAGATELVNVLELIIDAVKNGELDAQMEAASVKLRDGFKRTH